MKMDQVAGSGNDEFYTPRYAIEPLLEFVPKDKVIWCPFDTERSLIVRTLREQGWVVVATHLEDGFDFFDAPLMGDVIVSNPPYSLKNDVFARLFDLGVPFAMLVGIVGLFESEKRFSMFAANPFEMLYLNKRISYFKSYDDEKPALNPPFSSAWVCSKMLPASNVFRRVAK